MRFVEGNTFFEFDRAPDADERKAVLEQAALVNRVDYQPTYLFDSWAIPNIRAMFDKVRQFVEPDDLKLVEQAMARYEAIPLDDLPHCFVHGDFTKTNVLKGSDGKIYILDFSVANWYPRIQELSVIAANLLHDSNDSTSLEDRCNQVADEYSQFNQLTDLERLYLPAYALAGIAMEFMGAHQEKYVNGNDTDETDYWLNLGRNGLRKALTWPTVNSAPKYSQKIHLLKARPLDPSKFTLLSEVSISNVQVTLSINLLYSTTYAED